jgi:hypothetical protein
MDHDNEQSVNVGGPLAQALRRHIQEYYNVQNVIKEYYEVQNVEREQTVRVDNEGLQSRPDGKSKRGLGADLRE